MHYICVNLHQEETTEVCAMCGTPLGKRYVRDLDTRIVYHSVWCLETHIEVSLTSIQNAGEYHETKV